MRGGVCMFGDVRMHALCVHVLNRVQMFYVTLCFHFFVCVATRVCVSALVVGRCLCGAAVGVFCCAPALLRLRTPLLR